jgi:hypothetical protein
MRERYGDRNHQRIMKVNGRLVLAFVWRSRQRLQPRPRPGSRDASQSASSGTRKKVNFSRTGRSREKFRWRLVAVLTYKSLAKFG